jgi:hypothetical protein
VRDDGVVQFNAPFNVHTHFASEAALVLGGLASIGGCVRVYIVAKNAQTRILQSCHLCNRGSRGCNTVMQRFRLADTYLVR